MKQILKIAFADFWGGFEYNPAGKENYDNVFWRILSERYDLVVSNEPDYLIFSVFGSSYRNYHCKKILYTGENMRPNFDSYDFAISFDRMVDNRNCRFPLSAITLYENNITDNFEKSKSFEQVKSEKIKFCNFIYSNPNAQYRNELFTKLSKYKLVDAGGRVYNNLGYLVSDKLEFQKSYKFSIAFENSEYPGYTTEKIVHPKLVDSIPIYWGNPDVGLDWNTKSFINAYDYKNIDELVDWIIEVDRNDELYRSLVMSSHFVNNKKPKDLDYNNLLDFFESTVIAY
jgi:hypothetical protein